MYYKSTLDVKLKIKPVGTGFTHHKSYEGVCRTGEKEQLTVDYDRASNLEVYNNFLKKMDNLSKRDFEILKPKYIEIWDDFIMSRQDIDEIYEGLMPQDLVVFSGLLSQHPLTKFAMRFNNPVAMLDGWHVDGTSFLRSIGRECTGFYNPEDFEYYAKLLRCKKAISYMKVLSVEAGGHLKVGLKSSIYDLVGLEKKLGVEFVTLSSDNVLNMFDSMEEEHPDWIEESKQYTKKLISKATIVTMSEDYVERSVRFYILIKKLLEKYECNAFSIPCREVCAGGTLMNRKTVFCLAHSLLKDEGIVSSCEGDYAVMMGIAVLMNLTRKAPHMGNNLLDNVVSGIATVHHDVPCVHMKGYDQTLDYDIANFTVEGWGASMRYDFTQDLGETITLLRFDPSGTKMMAIKGVICKGDKYSSVTEQAMHAAAQGEIASDNGNHLKPGCTMMVKYKVQNGKRLYDIEKDYGHHFALVFGDHIQELKDLAKVMHLGIDTVE